MTDYKIILGATAAILSIAGHVPYMVTLARGTNRPHIFTWLIWTLLTAIAWAAQVAGHAGPGAWSTGMTLLMCIIITAMTLRGGEKQITKSDWVMFLAGLAAIPVWLLTDNPLGAVIIVTVIDALAFGPTFRKSWHKPREENITMYAVNIIRHVIALAALSVVSPITALYPAMLLVMNTVMAVMLTLRRRVQV